MGANPHCVFIAQPYGACMLFNGSFSVMSAMYNYWRQMTLACCWLVVALPALSDDYCEGFYAGYKAAYLANKPNAKTISLPKCIKPHTGIGTNVSANTSTDHGGSSHPGANHSDYNHSDFNHSDYNHSDYQRVIGNVLKVRQGPGTQYATLSRLYRGQPVVQIEQEGEWSHIEYTLPSANQAASGWVASAYIAPASDPVAASVNFSHFVDASAVRTRLGAGTHHDTVDKLFRDTRVNVIDSSNGWSQIRYSKFGEQRQGWVASRFLITLNERQSKNTTANTNPVATNNTASPQPQEYDLALHSHNLDCVERNGQIDYCELVIGVKAAANPPIKHLKVTCEAQLEVQLENNGTELFPVSMERRYTVSERPQTYSMSSRLNNNQTVKLQQVSLQRHGCAVVAYSE